MYAQCRHKNGITKKSYCCYKLLDEKSFYVSNILNKILVIFTFAHVAYVSKVELFHTSYIKRLLRCNFPKKKTHIQNPQIYRNSFNFQMEYAMIVCNYVELIEI